MAGVRIASRDRIDNHSHLWRKSSQVPIRDFPTVYVCICNGVTDRDIRQAAEAGCRSLPELTMRTGCGATCGTCLDAAAAILEEARHPRELPMLQVAA